MNLKILSFCVLIVMQLSYAVGEKTKILIPSYNNAAWYRAAKAAFERKFIHHSSHISYTQEPSSEKDNVPLKHLSKL